MARQCRMIAIFSWSLALSLFALRVNSNAIRTAPRCRWHQVSQVDDGNELCLRTVSCGQVAHSPNHSLEHVRGLVNEFLITLSNYIATVDNARTLLEVRYSVPIAHWGLENLYPLIANSDDLTGSISTDQHRSLREMRWLLTSAAFSMRLLHTANYAAPDVSSNLAVSVTEVSRKFHNLLATFRVRGLSQQEICVQSSQETVPYTRRARFTIMALRDVRRALNRFYEALSACQVQQQITGGGNHFTLQCESPIFYLNAPAGIQHLLQPSSVLSSNE